MSKRPYMKKDVAPEEVGGSAETLDEALSQAVERFDGELRAEAAAEEAAEAVEAAQHPDKYIIKETQIDKFTVKRERVKLSPAVCDKCGFDVTARNNLGKYSEMPPVMQQQVRDAVAEHKKLVHTTAEDLIVSEDNLPTQWLGSHKKF